MSTHNICLYEEVKKKYTGCNLKTTEFLDCALIEVCAVIRANMVSLMKMNVVIIILSCGDANKEIIEYNNSSE